MKRVYMTDKEVCALLLITPQTLWRILTGYRRGGKFRHTFGAVVNIADAKPETLGGFRRWKIANVAKVLGITEEEILDVIK